MRISDWSSDVCSSYLADPVQHRGLLRGSADRPGRGTGEPRRRRGLAHPVLVDQRAPGAQVLILGGRGPVWQRGDAGIGDRKSDVKGTSVTVGADTGGRRLIKKNNDIRD